MTVWLRDLVGVVLHPMRRLPLVTGRSLLAAGLAVGATGVAAAGLSILAALVEPASAVPRGAALAVSLALPVLFLAVWVVDAAIVDAVARTMGCPSRRRVYLTTSGFCLPPLATFEAVRVLQAAIDRAGPAAGSAATAIGYLDFAVLAWFTALVTLAIRVVYGLPTLSALAAAFAPPAAMATVLVGLLVVASLLHAAGIV